MDSKAFANFVVTAVSCCCKFPQVMLILRTGSVASMSLLSMILEITCTSTTFCYFVANNYPKADYLEYPFLLFQSLILFSLVAYYRSYPALKCVGVFILYILLVYGFAHQILPYMLLQLMATFFTIPMNTMSKLAQIRAIYQTKRGDLISKVPWFVYGMTSAIRIFTVISEKVDYPLIMYYCMSVFMNSMVILSAIIFVPDKSKDKKKDE